MLVKSRIKYIQSLSQKKSRDEHGVFVAEGPKIVADLLRAQNIKPQHIFALPGWIDRSNITAEEVSDTQLRQLSHLVTPNEVVGVFYKPEFEEIIGWRNEITIVLDSIQDPGNLGTIIRCADWFGIRRIVCSEECADAFNPKTVQSTMGSICRVNVFYKNLNRFLSEREAPLYAAALEGESVKHIRKPGEGFILIGNESRGVARDLLQLADYTVTIPRRGEAESLNAAIATAIILSHLAL